MQSVLGAKRRFDSLSFLLVFPEPCGRAVLGAQASFLQLQCLHPLLASALVWSAAFSHVEYSMLLGFLTLLCGFWAAVLAPKVTASSSGSPSTTFSTITWGHFPPPAVIRRMPWHLARASSTFTYGGLSSGCPPDLPPWTMHRRRWGRPCIGPRPVRRLPRLGAHRFLVNFRSTPTDLMYMSDVAILLFDWQVQNGRTLILWAVWVAAHASNVSGLDFVPPPNS